MSELRQDFYPMNQDSISRDAFVYSSTLSMIAELVRKAEANGVGSEEAILAQVEKDLRYMLDQMWKPQ